MYDQVVKCQRAGLCLSEHFLISDCNVKNLLESVNNKNNEKALGETQTLRAGCSKVEAKNFAPPQTPFRGRSTAKIYATGDHCGHYLYIELTGSMSKLRFDGTWDRIFIIQRRSRT